MKKIEVTNQIISILVLPFNVTITIPSILLYIEKIRFRIYRDSSISLITLFLGVVFCIIGLYLLMTTISLFINIGKGTLAPWEPTQRLVVKGPYRFVRNPMICGVLFILLGEVLIFKSIYIFIWVMIFFFINNAYFILVEEPGLRKRFGEEYIDYKQKVPRWIPRLTPWEDWQK